MYLGDLLPSCYIMNCWARDYTKQTTPSLVIDMKYQAESHPSRIHIFSKGLSLLHDKQFQKSAFQNWIWSDLPRSWTYLFLSKFFENSSAWFKTWSLKEGVVKSISSTFVPFLKGHQYLSVLCLSFSRYFVRVH